MLKFLLPLLAVFLVSCAPAAKDAPRAERSFFAMDTYISMTACGDGADAALAEVQERIHAAERRLSVTLPDSEIHRLNAAGDADVSPETADLLRFALSMSDETDGAFHPALYPVLTAWGFTTPTQRVPSDEEIAALLPLTDLSRISVTGNHVTLTPGTELDFGAIAKGAAGEDAIQFLKSRGIPSALVNLGGNVQTLGARPDGSPWRVGLASPWGAEYLGLLESKDEAIVTSGSYQRFFEADGKKYHHILDPASGRPAESGLVSATVVTQNGARTDALSTALFVMGAEKAAGFWRRKRNFDFLLITTGKEILITAPLAKRFRLADEFQNLKVTVVK